MTATQVQWRRGTAGQVAAFTGAAGEITADMTNFRTVLHDGATVGGHQQASIADVNAAVAIVSIGANPLLLFATCT